MSNKSSGVTSSDVARVAGVSQSAVSRAFTPGASISDHTRARVLAAASKLGYRPNAIARTLITRQSQIVAVVASYLENPFYLSVIEQISHLLRKEGYHLLLLVSDTGEADEFLMQLMQYQADGVILVSTTLSSTIAQTCEQMGVPVVLFNRISKHGNVNSVASDNYAGGRLAARTLLDAGHRDVAFIAGLENTSTSRDRELGFKDELSAAGITRYQRAVGHYSFHDARAAVIELFERRSGGWKRPEAVFVANDHMAIAVLDTLRHELRLRVPHDVSVIGFDNAAPAGWLAYQLTTIEQPARSMVENTVDLLIRQMRGSRAKAQAVIAPVRLIVRETVRGLSPTTEEAATCA